MGEAGHPRCWRPARLTLFNHDVQPTMKYDLIGDLHGHAESLERLLARLGYQWTQGTYRSPDPERQVIFLGDYIDRGPEQRRTLEVVRSMVEAGSAQALMGNHEFNAIGYATPDGKDYLRPHSRKNWKQHQAFLREHEGDPAGWASVIAWFKTLPLWLDLGGVRAVHACWHEPAQQRLHATGWVDAQGRVSPEGWSALATSPDLEVLLKGPEYDLKADFFTDRDGHRRHECRIRWWADAPQTPADVLFDAGQLTLTDPERQQSILQAADAYRYTGAPPVFFGHYWLRTPLVRPNLCCLDLSVARNGHLAAYCWQGEASLTPEHLVVVSA